MESFDNLNSTHFDILQEIGNIGAGNAVTSMAKILDKKVDMEVPNVNITDFKDIANFIGGPECLVAGILVSLSGDINGMMMFLVKTDSARKLMEILMGDIDTKLTGAEEPGDDAEWFNSLEMSALEEIGNILTSSYLGAIAGLLDKRIIPSVPFLSIDMANALLSVPAIEFSKVADKVLLIESVFNATSDERVSGYFLLVPDMPSFGVILSSLGVM